MIWTVSGGWRAEWLYGLVVLHASCVNTGVWADHDHVSIGDIRVLVHQEVVSSFHDLSSLLFRTSLILDIFETLSC